MTSHKVKDIYPKLDNIGKFIQFDRASIIESIKEELVVFQDKFDGIETKYQSLTQENIEQKEILNTTIESLDSIQNKYDLVKIFLDASPLENEAF